MKNDLREILQWLMRPVTLKTAAFVIALCMIGTGLMAAIIWPHLPPSKQAPDRAVYAIEDRLEPKPIRVIPIVRQQPQQLAAADPQPETPRIDDQRKLPEAMPPPPSTVTTPSIAPLPKAEPAAEPEDPPHYRNHRHQSGGGHDLCSRTGGWKVVTHGGRSWRCAYAGRL
jgi:hypothetical protein